MTRPMTRVSVAALLTLFAVAAPWSTVAAQSAIGDVEGFVSDPDAAIEINADQLDINREAGTAVFSGSVRAIQGGMRLSADHLEVDYATGASGAENATGKIERLTARGGVMVISEGDRSAQGDRAVYDVAGRMITMTGNVILQQQDNVIRGADLTIDLATGQSRIDGEGGGRVRGLFQPPASGSEPEDSP